MAEPFNQQNAWADQEAARVRQCLAVHGNRFEYQKTLGRGAFGVACLIRHNRRDGTTRNFVVKRALSEKDQRNLQKEVDLAKVRSQYRRRACVLYDSFASSQAYQVPFSSLTGEPFVNRK